MSRAIHKYNRAITQANHAVRRSRASGHRYAMRHALAEKRAVRVDRAYVLRQIGESA